MKQSISSRFAAAAGFVLMAGAPARSADPADPAGVLWETTSQMVMTGMPFSPPPQTTKVCTAAVWNQPPPGGDPSCRSSDYRVEGNKATWKMQCGGRMPMEGTGDITFEGTDSYTGAINATADGVTVTINLSGRKIGTCDNPQ